MRASPNRAEARRRLALCVGGAHACCMDAGRDAAAHRMASDRRSARSQCRPACCRATAEYREYCQKSALWTRITPWPARVEQHEPARGWAELTLPCASRRSVDPLLRSMRPAGLPVFFALARAINVTVCPQSTASAAAVHAVSPSRTPACCRLFFPSRYPRFPPSEFISRCARRRDTKTSGPPESPICTPPTTHRTRTIYRSHRLVRCTPTPNLAPMPVISSPLAVQCAL